MSPLRVIAHFDMDAFFAAIEERDRPHLRGLPIAVGADPQQGRGRGVVSTANYPARAYGLHSALPISRAWQLSESARRRGLPPVVFLPVRMAQYAEVSARIMAQFREAAAVVEPASIDEAYLDLSATGSFADAESHCRQLCAAIHAQEQLTASVGIGPNKLIAKIASGMQKPAGLTVVPAEQVAAFLDPLPIQTIPGIGPKSTARLAQLGVKTVHDLLAWPPSQLDHAFGRRGREWYDKIRGQDQDPLVAEWTPKSIGEQDTFETDTKDPTFLLDYMHRLCNSVWAKLHEEGFHTCRTIVLTVRFSDFTTVTRSHTVATPVETERTLYAEGMKLFLPFLDRRDNPQGKRLRLVGLRVERLA